MPFSIHKRYPAGMRNVVAVTAADRAAYDAALEQLVVDRVASRIAAQDPTLWGAAAAAEAGKRLGWVRLPESSRPLLRTVSQLRARFLDAGLDRVVLCGMGGSSLGPEVICAAAGVPLEVLDSSDPDRMRDALGPALRRSVVVISSKSGSTLETDSQRRALEQALVAAGRDPREHVVVVTDPGSPLDVSARDAGYTVINADPDVGGRFSALSAYGIVPCGLAGVDIELLLQEAATSSADLGLDRADNPALQLGALLGVACRAGADKLVMVDDDPGAPGFGDWAEQLIAESTGKDGRGILPVVVPSPRSPNAAGSTTDEVTVRSGDEIPATSSGWAAAVKAPLGGALLLWEYAVSVAGRLLAVNPFDQPDVESAKQASRKLLDGTGAAATPVLTDGPLQVFTSGSLATGADSTAEAVEALLATLDAERGYLAVMAYLDRERHAGLASVRDALARRTGRPTTFGWGPRFLHSTGQYHKGGAPTGAFLQITADPIEDAPIPGRPFTFGQFILAQAAGDAAVLASHDRPVLRLHLTDQVAGMARLKELLS
jgi:glucose-6-phosphate isomerase